MTYQHPGYYDVIEQVSQFIYLVNKASELKKDTDIYIYTHYVEIGSCS
jgi:hypothetical protein